MASILTHKTGTPYTSVYNMKTGVMGSTSIGIGLNSHASGQYNIAIGRPHKAGIFLYGCQFKGLTLNFNNIPHYDTVSRNRKIEYNTKDYDDLVGKIFTADVNVYDNLIQVHLTSGGWQEFLYANIDEFHQFWDILDRRVLIEKIGHKL